MVSLDFSVTYSFQPYHGSAPSENEYQEHFLGVKAAGVWGWPHHLHVPNVMEIWEPKPPGNLWATLGLLQEPFTFFLHVVILVLYIFYTSTYIANIIHLSLQGMLMQNKGRCEFHKMLPV